jgi:hypothetical protein
MNGRLASKVHNEHRCPFLSRDSNILRDLATIEADVSSHAEAVLHDRISKITQEKINLEQQQQKRAAAASTAMHNGPFQVGEGNTGSSGDSPDADDEINCGLQKTSKGGRQIVEDFRRKLRKAIR